MSMVMPRRFSSSSRSASIPVRALTRAVLPWSICPAVPATMLFMASAFILLPANEGLAQTATFRAGVSLVKVDAQVSHPGGRVVQGLTQQDFQVFDDGRPQKIAYFGQDAEPLDLVLLLDVSGSMHRYLELLGATASSALKQLYASDRVAVVLFAKRAEVREPLTQDFHAVEKEVRDAVHTESLGSGTSINASVVATAQYLEKEPV